MTHSLERLIVSFKYCGLDPSGPSAKPFGNDLLAQATSSAGTDSKGLLMISMAGGIQEPGRGEKCFTFKAVMVVSLISAMEFSEYARQTALLKSPSSFSDTLQPKDSMGDFIFFSIPFGGMDMIQGSSSSFSFLLTMVAKDRASYGCTE